VLEHLTLVGALVLPLLDKVAVHVAEEVITQFDADLLLILFHASALILFLGGMSFLNLLLFIFENFLRLQSLLSQNLLVSLHDAV